MMHEREKSDPAVVAVSYGDSALNQAVKFGALSP